LEACGICRTKLRLQKHFRCAHPSKPELNEQIINIKEEKKVNHFINFKDLIPDYLEAIIDQAVEIKHNPAQYAEALAGKNMYMLFQKTSTAPRFLSR